MQAQGNQTTPKMKGTTTWMWKRTRNCVTTSTRRTLAFVRVRPNSMAHTHRSMALSEWLSGKSRLTGQPLCYHVLLHVRALLCPSAHPWFTLVNMIPRLQVESKHVSALSPCVSSSSCLSPRCCAVPVRAEVWFCSLCLCGSLAHCCA